MYHEFQFRAVYPEKQKQSSKSLKKLNNANPNDGKNSKSFFEELLCKIFGKSKEIKVSEENKQLNKMDEIIKIKGCRFGKEYIITNKTLGVGGSCNVNLGYEITSGKRIACKIMNEKDFDLYENEKYCAWLLRSKKGICKLLD